MNTLEVIPENTAPITAVDLAQHREESYKRTAARISAAYESAHAAAQHALRKVVACGLLMLEQKAELPHGQFGNWLEVYLPEIPRRTATSWMDTAKAAVGILQIGNSCQFDDAPDLTLPQILEMPADELPEAAAEIRDRMIELLDGNTAKQLVFAFKAPVTPPTGKGRKLVPAEEQERRDEKSAITALREMHEHIGLFQLTRPWLQLRPMDRDKLVSSLNRLILAIEGKTA